MVRYLSVFFVCCLHVLLETVCCKPLGALCARRFSDCRRPGAFEIWHVFAQKKTSWKLFAFAQLFPSTWNKVAVFCLYLFHVLDQPYYPFFEVNFFIGNLAHADGCTTCSHGRHLQQVGLQFWCLVCATFCSKEVFGFLFAKFVPTPIVLQMWCRNVPGRLARLPLHDMFEYSVCSSPWPPAKICVHCLAAPSVNFCSPGNLNMRVLKFVIFF